MPRLIVISDANFYIGLTDPAIADLVLREHSNGVIAWASYFVVDELIARAGDADAREAGKGVAGLRRLSQHCAMYDGHQRVNFLADPRTQLAQALFGIDRTGDPRKADVYGSVIRQILSEPSREAWPEWVADFVTGMGEHVRSGEEHFVAGIWDGIVKTLVPDALDWPDVLRDRAKAAALATAVIGDEGYDLCAQMIAENVAGYADVAPSEGILQRAVEILKRAFPLSMRTFNALLYRVLTRGVDVSKASVSNTIWDMQLGMSIPASARIADTPVWLLTSDELIHEAAEDYIPHLVRRTPEYLALTSDGEAWREQIARF